MSSLVLVKKKGRDSSFPSHSEPRRLPLPTLIGQDRIPDALEPVASAHQFTTAIRWIRLLFTKVRDAYSSVACRTVV
jgi:hypothetical protein